MSGIKIGLGGEDDVLEARGRALDEATSSKFTTSDDFLTVADRVARGTPIGEAITGVRLPQPSEIPGLFRAAVAQQEATERVGADDNLRREYYDGLNAKLLERGIRLENPLRGGYWEESGREWRQIARAQNAAQYRGEDVTLDMEGRPGVQRRIYERKVEEAIQSQPELNDIVSAAKIQFDPHLQRRAREQELEARQSDAGVIGSLATSLGAGVFTTARDPVEMTFNVAFGGGPGMAAKAGLRLLEVAAKEGLVNLGITAATLPAILERRNISGIKAPEGVMEIVQELGFSALIGAVLGVAIQGGRELTGIGLPSGITNKDIEATARALNGTGGPEDLQTAVRTLGLTLDEATEKELAAIARSMEVEKAAATPPPGIPEDLHNVTLGAAVRHAEDPTQTIAPPPLPRPEPTAASLADDDTVRAALPASATTLDELLGPLRADGRLAYLAATSSSPDLEALGRLALMDDRALEFALSGQLPIDQVARVGAMVGAPEEQVAVLQSLARNGVQTLEQVSERVSDELGATRIAEATHTLLPTPERVTEIAPAEPPGGAPIAKAEAAAPGTPAAGEAIPGASTAVPEAGAAPAGPSFTQLQQQGKLSQIVNAIDVNATPDEKVRQLQALTAENQPIVDKLIKDIDAEFGTESKANLKDPAKIIEKASRPSILAKKPWHQIEHIRDSFRFKTVVNSVLDVERIVQKLEASGIEIVKRDVDKVLAPEEWGWRIAAFDLRMPNGQLVEFYLPVRELEEAKKAGHLLFEKWRNEDPSKLPLAMQEERLTDLQASRDLYQSAWDAFLARSGDSETDIRASLTRAATASGSSTGLNSSLSSPNVRPPGAQTPAELRTAPNVPDSVLSATTAAAEPSRSVQASETVLGASGTQTSVSDLVTPGAIVETPEARQAVARVDAVNQLKEVPAYTPETAPPPSPGEMAGVFMFDPAKLKVDAQRFQFKEESDAEGVSTRLRGVTKWDPAKAGQLIVWEAKDGTLYVADGHQRTGLARRLQREGKVGDIEMTGALYRESDGYSPGDVKALAALVNISQGTGSALDIAHVLRKRPGALDESVPLTAGAARQGANLAKLEDEPFRMIVNKVIPEHYGAIVGELLPGDAARQADAIKQIATLEPRNVNEATYLVQRVREAEMQRAADASQMTFLDDTPESTVGEEMRIFNKVKAELEKDKTLFKRVLANVGRIEETGSKIARPEAETMLTESALAAKLIESGFTSGPVSEAIKEAASNVKAGNQTLAGATRDVLGVVRREAEANVPGGRGPSGGVQTPGSALTEPTAAGEQTLIPGVEPVTNQARLNLEAQRKLAGGTEPPPEGGLFDLEARNQEELFGPTKPFAENDIAQAKPVAAPDGSTRLATPEEQKAELERPAHLSDAVKSCKG